MAFIIFEQTLTMLGLMAVGLWLTKSGAIDEVFTKKLGYVLVNVIVPCLALNGFMDPPEGAQISDFLLSFGLSLLLLVIAAAVGFVAFGRRKPIEAFGNTVINAGFIGVPIVTAVFGPSAMFYVAATVALNNIIQFTYGCWLLTGDTSLIKPKAILTNPVVVASVLGVILFVTGFQLPAPVASGVKIMSNANTAVAMIILGSQLAGLDWKTAFNDVTAFVSIALRLVVAPLLSILVLKVLGFTLTPLVAAIFIDVICPMGVNTAVMAQQFDMDYEHAVKIVCLSTILCVVTMPLMFQLATIVLGS